MRVHRCLKAGLPAVVLVASLGLTTPAGAGPVGDAEPAVALSPTVSTVVTVTLITGDRVSLVGQDRAVIHRQPGREHVTYLSQRMGDDLYVIPTDALPLLRSGQLDRRLFNVSLLVEFGYHERPDLPLIVVDGVGPAAVEASLAAADGVDVVRDLPAVGGSAVRVDRSALAGFWGDLVGRSAGITAAGVSKVWLDGLRRPLLDQSVPQVGAPQAWAAGLDGTGVTVAVLDTGIDTTHPDLSDRVVASENFTDGFEEDGDLVGHGTHVASILAGSGAASGGQFRGVAPGADLLDGKVCVEFGCLESWILAGMQWAAEQGADVVNLSLGGFDTEEVDPLEQAVEDLTAEFGVLFVIAAGNDFSDRSINSPGSADSALTVGAVDKADELADFSSRGPRIDGALKPDLTAPGVGIVAANSSTGFLGEPGEPYTTLSGTSMATPHVAGAAAILRQQHPDWSPAQVKAALMGSAMPHPALNPYAQGAGRLDVARAITQTVLADPPSVSFDRPAWPHEDDEPQTATVTYRNDGPADVTLTLDLSTIGPDGLPAPEGFFTLSDTSVTIPAGGTAQVSITADTSVGDVDGFFGGHLTASGADVQVTTPFAVEREVESYDVTLVHTDRDGQPAGYFTTLYRTDDFGIVDVFGPPTVTVRVPAGEYTLMSFVIGPGEEPEVSLMAQPRLVVDSDLTVEVDARLAGPISITVPAADATQALGSVSADLSTEFLAAGFSVLSDNFDEVFSGRIGPDETVSGFASSVAGGWARFDPETFFSASPYSYDVAYFEPGRMMTGFHRDLNMRDLARVVAEHAAHVPGALGSKFSVGMHPEVFGGVAVAYPTELPFTRVEYHNTDGGVLWQKSLFEELPSDNPEEPFPELISITDGPVTAYQAPRTYHETWNQGVFGPGLPERSLFGPAALRVGDELMLVPRPFNDAVDRDVASLIPEANIAVFRDGELIFEAPDLFALVDVPAGEATYRMEVEAVRDERFPLSTRVGLAWTFRSGHVDDGTEVLLPVSVVRFTPKLDEHNTAPAGRTFPVPVQVVSQGGAGPLVDLTVEVSYDDGQTWREVPVRGGKVVLRHPAGDGFVSLRASGVDADGNVVEQTIIRAYRFTSDR